MFVVRPITPIDIEAMFTFSKAASRGIANLPTHPPRMHKLIDDAVQSFKKNVSEPDKEIYSFILENTLTKEKVGTCSILSKAGARAPYGTFYIENLPEGEVYPPDGCNHALLYPRNYENEGPSELCALYLLPAFRKGGLGKLLSLSRLLFVAINRQRFTENIFADMRGYITPEGRTPFWESVGEKIWKYTFQEVLEKLDREEITLSELLPHYPIHWCMISPEAQKYVGKTHPNTQAAYYLLNNQGLCYQREVSILDGGPLVMAPISAVHTVSKSKVVVVEAIVESLETPGTDVLICAEDKEFRATCARIEIVDNHSIKIDRLTASALNLELQERARYVVL